MISSIRLRDFKNFADETLRLGPFTVIVGANASGKSNIRDAFRILHGVGRGYALEDILGGAADWDSIRGAANEILRFGSSEFSLEAKIDPFDREPEPPAPAELTYTLRVGRDEASDGRFRVVEARCRSDAGHSWKIEADSRSNGGMANRRLLPNPMKEEEPGQCRVGREIERMFHGMRFLDPNPNLMRAPSFPGQSRLGDGGENLPTVLQEICSDPHLKRVLLEWIDDLTPMDVRDFEFPVDPSGRTHLVICEANGRKVSAYSASDGALRFLAVLAALFGPDPARLYFMEEIEIGLHPARLHLLLDLIETQTGGGGTQVVATTHSPALLTAMGDRTFENASVVCRLPDTDDSIIRPLRDILNARVLRKEQGMGRLLEGGWMERALDFTEAAE